MTGQDGLRDELVAALEAIDNLADNYELADRLLPVVQRHIDTARGQDLAAIETQIAEHVATHTQAAREQVAEQIARAIEDNAARVQGSYADGLSRAANIARQHAKGDGDE